jgi:hypothetical protein
MAKGSARTPQQRDAHELARTPQANPYRGTMLDPFAARPLPIPEPAATATPRPFEGSRTTKGSRTTEGSRTTDQPVAAPWTPTVMPAPATIAGVLGFLLSLAMALFGISLLALLSLQSDYGAPDRSFYRGADSGSVVLALIDFALAGGCAVGAILLLGGRVLGRVSCTVSGWLILYQSAFWYLRGQAGTIVPLVVALAAAAMLLLSYQGSVTRWLGVLRPAQPDL